MRRVLGVVLSLALVAGACTSDGKGKADDAKGKAAPASSTSTAGPSTTAADPSCRFTEPAPEGEITWVANDGKLMAVAPSGGAPHCLFGGVDAEATHALDWSGDAQRVLAGNRVVGAQGVLRAFEPSAALVLSRPTGRSVLGLDLNAGRLTKFENLKGQADITFAPSTKEVLYHPAGRSIVAVSKQGPPRLVIADNLGRNPRPLAEGETATDLSDLAFTAKNALLFVAHHEGAVELHRLELESGKLTTVKRLTNGEDIAFVRTSPFPGGSVAWWEGQTCEGKRTSRLVVEQDGAFVDVSHTDVAAAVPVGWLPDRSLVVLKTGGCESGPGGDLYRVTISGGRAQATLVAPGVIAPAVRAVLPAPEEAPADIPDQAPA